jgi:transposase
MEDGVFRISERQISRHHLLRMVIEDQMTLAKAASAMNVSYRHAKRMKKEFIERGMGALIHGNRGRSPWNKVSEEARAEVVRLCERYVGFNDSHFAEVVAGKEGIAVCRETLRVIRREAGIRPKCQRRVRRHYKRRPRRECEGLMILWDGSVHRWFGRDSAPCCLMAAMDDATGKVVGLLFVEHECSWAYLELLRRVVGCYGIPGSVYQDRHSSLRRNDDFWSIEEELAGRQDPTQVGYALEALGIEPIFAATPQAKGRVERLFKTLQDRLCAALILEGITDIESANRYIQSVFLDEFNQRFATSPENVHKAWRKPRPNLDLTRVCSFRYDCKVANDNTIRYYGATIDIPPGPNKSSYAGILVELRQLLDGSWRVYHKDKLIASAPATPIAEPIRAKRRDKGERSAKHAQWIYAASAVAPQACPAALPNTVRRAAPGRTIGATRIA